MTIKNSINMFVKLFEWELLKTEKDLFDYMFELLVMEDVQLKMRVQREF